jgi:hypothetical protein
LRQKLKTYTQVPVKNNHNFTDTKYIHLIVEIKIFKELGVHLF